MPDIHINNHGVEQLLTDLDPNKATGPDGMPACILKMGEKTTIFRKPVQIGANIPIFKKGHCTFQLYRPVSLTSML